MSSEQTRRDRVFVNWQREKYGFRSEKLAQSLEAEPLQVFKKSLFGRPLPAPLRYVFQSVRTFRRLMGLRARTIIVQTPPWPLTATVWLYCRLFKGQFITDNHSSVFHDRRWQWFNFIDRFFARRAAANLAHNHKNLEILQRWKARNPLMVLSPALFRQEILDPAAQLPPQLAQAADTGALKILVVNRFAVDDCWREVFQVASIMPEARFFITGDPDHVKLALDQPKNLVLTGFLSHTDFLKLMDSCDLVLTLTSRPDTLLWSIRECLALDKPFVATGNQVILANFDGYGVFTDNSVEDIASKIMLAHEKRDEFTPKMAAYIAQDKLRWQHDIDTINQILR